MGAGGEEHLVVLLQVGIQGGDASRINVQHLVCRVHWCTECLIAGQNLHEGLKCSRQVSRSWLADMRQGSRE